ncbi:MAG TPA: hypothetical protein VNC39_15390 [Acidocella sp.]|jgi:hypothetical protein|uniref:hypothetical protein n=1 Tax=Acidocella sp. TaxID=50710 RepID=UPI002C7B1E6F|nr:hypothetical protein [Acidocella sp.]HVE23354.1 hypothetical protein [Acidocella sp.]
MSDMAIQEFVSRTWDMLLGRVGGPFTLRFVVQPSVAVAFAIRAGLRDARKNRPPYLWALVMNPATRRDLLREGWRDIRNVFIIALVLDAIYVLIVHRWVYPGQTLLVAVVLAIVPYLLIRGPVARLIYWLRRG